MSQPRGIDGLFYDLLVQLPDKIDLGYLQKGDPKLTRECIKDKLQQIGRRIFIEPYESYQEHSILETFLIDKSIAVNELYKFFWQVFGYGAAYELHHTMRQFEVFSFAGLEEELKQKYTTISSEALSRLQDQMRDHVLHQFNTFLVGLHLYLNSKVVQQYYEQMLRSSRYMALIPPRGSNIMAQFLEQWFVLATMHDYGEVLERVHPFSMANEVVSRYNKRIKSVEVTKSGKLPPVDKIKMRIDVGRLFQVNFDHFDYAKNEDIYREALEDLERLEDHYFQDCLEKGKTPELDHGINGAKLLLKMFNMASKASEGRDIYQKYVMRNFIGPIKAIARHNLVADEVLTEPISFGRVRSKCASIPSRSIVSNWPDKTVTVETNAFQKDFLLTLLVSCDESANFDRFKIEKTALLDPDLKFPKATEVELGHEHELRLDGLAIGSERITIRRQEIH